MLSIIIKLCTQSIAVGDIIWYVYVNQLLVSMAVYNKTVSKFTVSRLDDLLRTNM